MAPSRHLNPWLRLGLAVAGGYLGARALEVSAVRALARKALVLAASTLAREALMAWREQHAAAPAAPGAMSGSRAAIH